MATFAVNRFIQFSLGIPRRALLTSRAKRAYDSARCLKHTAGRCSQRGKTQKLTALESYEKKESSLFRGGVSNREREACSFKSVAGRFSLQSSGDGSQYEMSSFAEELECDASNDIGQFLEFVDSTASEMFPMECEFVEEPEQLFDTSQAVSENTLSKRDKADINKMKEDAGKMAVELLATRGLLNDGLYAESFSQSRWISSSWGPRRIRTALLQKGVSEADINKATNLVFKDSDSSSGPLDMHLGMSKISIDRLFVQASKQWLRGQNVSLANRRSRMMRWLQYRGFDWGLTNFILKKLESKYPP